MTLLTSTARRAAAALAAAAFAAVCALPAAAAEPAPAAPLTREDVEKIVRETLIKNPEILQEVAAELEKRASADESERRKLVLEANRERLLGAPQSAVLGNPQGDVTVVEFFDYNCGFCKRALTDLIELMKTDDRVRVVLKDFPVLRESSVDAAKVAVAVKVQATPAKFLEFHQKLMGGRAEATRERALAVAKEVGLDMARLAKDIDSDGVKASLQETFQLAQDLGLSGTPSYVIGDNVLIGAVGLPKLQDHVKSTRDSCKTTRC
ncbi:DsbA family protein [Blastochloris viridis]|uniref:Protein-disulfide isomerase n=1 Tax=Blastochloris viridis TaxID=1079 RepID=A0A0H5BNH0_BLAVI|nr:DsbA family protein [Blastochloris viridis]ALK08894.1 DSBA-like thioredoxin domain protein [Blastochloris viridis]BAR97803.1 protein-disulfide isomerase [Blastochloris viridis]CUU41555.1 Protein-disulfide isomerase [Blastochloris viridis]